MNTATVMTAFKLLNSFYILNINKQVSVTACTTGGCSESPKTEVTTEPSVPMETEPPICTVVSERVVEVTWNPPKYPNGPGLFKFLSIKSIKTDFVIYF